MLVQASSIDGLPIGALPRQDLPKAGCAAYLFTTGETRAFAAMVTPDRLRIVLDGRTLDVARTGQSGPVRIASPATATIAATDWSRGCR
ncbi:hypothetical protein AB5I41_15295 [Sphingomonas sp. MMS24-JH45]